LLVSVITLLAVIPLISQDSIAASGNSTRIGAVVATLIVSIITELNADTNNPITAAGDQTVITAGVGVDAIAVVTSFVAFITLTGVDTTQAITASR
jgi:hypothetical protein